VIFVHQFRDISQTAVKFSQHFQLFPDKQSPCTHRYSYANCSMPHYRSAREKTGRTSNTQSMSASAVQQKYGFWTSAPRRPFSTQKQRSLWHVLRWRLTMHPCLIHSTLKVCLTQSRLASKCCHSVCARFARQTDDVANCNQHITVTGND